MQSRLIARFALREALGLLFMGLALFWSAGRIDWWAGWALTVTTLAWIVATALVILRHSPDLLAERLGPREGSQRWDTALMSVHGLVQLSTFVVAGLDHRVGWSAGISTPAQLTALAVCCLGYGLVVWATASNPFFSQIVRIQTERVHRVVTKGPYQYVRHPAYLGGVLTLVSIPILLGSWWALLLGSLDALLMILRTVLEDRTLRRELPGYPEYARHVRARLIPRIW